MPHDDPHCPSCEDAGTFGVVMVPFSIGWRCPECGHVLRVGPDPGSGVYGGKGNRTPDPFADRELRREIRECWAEDASRHGRDVPPDVTGSEATGRAKDATPPRSATVSRGIRLDDAPAVCVCGCERPLRGGRRRYATAECEREADAARKRRERMGA